MPTFNALGFIWAGTGTPTTLLPVTITDDDPNMSPYFTNDLTENLTIAGTTYNNPRGGTYRLTFTDSGGTTHTEDLLLWSTGSNFVFVPLPGSAFDTGTVIDSLGGWQSYTSGFTWTTVVCFGRGTEILTPTGLERLENLKKGSLVLVKDKEAQPIKWIGKQKIIFADMQPDNAEKLYPVRISAGSLGQGLPTKDLLVSQQHRMLVDSKICQRMFGATQALVAAKYLTALPGIFIDKGLQDIEYIHVVFDLHEIVFACSAPSESMFLGPQALLSLPPDALEEIQSLFPELSDSNFAPDSAAFIPISSKQRKLIERHAKNGQPLI